MRATYAIHHPRNAQRHVTGAEIHITLIEPFEASVVAPVQAGTLRDDVAEALRPLTLTDEDRTALLDEACAYAANVAATIALVI